MLLNIILWIVGIASLLEAIDNWYSIGKKLLILGLVAILLANSIVIIPFGHIGVKTSTLNGDCESVDSNVCLKAPFVQKVTKIDCRQQDKEFRRMKIGSMTYNATITYMVNPDKAAFICTNVKYGFLERMIPGRGISSILVTEDVVKASIGKSVSDATDSNLESIVMTNLQDALDKKYEKNTVLVKIVTISVNAMESSISSASKSESTAEKETNTSRAGLTS